MHCPKCYSEKFVKNGIKYNKQRYKCKNCGCNFTQSKKRGASLETKLQALKLYLEGMGFRSIGRIMKVSNVTYEQWGSQLKITYKHRYLMILDILKL